MSDYVFTATLPQCSAMVDIATDYKRKDSYRHDGRVMGALKRRHWVTAQHNLTPLGVKALHLAECYIVSKKLRAA